MAEQVIDWLVVNKQIEAVNLMAGAAIPIIELTEPEEPQDNEEAKQPQPVEPYLTAIELIITNHIYNVKWPLSQEQFIAWLWCYYIGVLQFGAAGNARMIALGDLRVNMTEQQTNNLAWLLLKWLEPYIDLPFFEPVVAGYVY
ncbi:MAG: hypothetical protein FWE37_05110 [Spirochaetaceae bacterium]|nr:hypothetical protein [Spirochaetaceae bacterium]